MQNVENVYEIKNQTEQGSKINQEQLTGSADLGKFKDVNALLHAYESLQAEFTRRSQRLKRYEEQENQRQNAMRINGETPQTVADCKQAEKPDELQSDCETNTSDLAHLPTQSAVQGDTDHSAVAVGTGQADALADDCVRPCDSAEANVTEHDEDGKTVAENNSACADKNAVELKREIQADCVEEQSAQGLYEQASANEEVRLRIVGDYLASIGKSNAPLIRGGASALVTPPKKPRNIADAGNMALAYFKAYKEQV